MPSGRRYRIWDQLGVGGMGEVYRALDRLTGQNVALKRVITSPHKKSEEENLEYRLALAQEFQSLASLRHPNIINVLDYGFDDDDVPYFTMELLDHPQDILEATQNQPVEVQVDLLIQVLQALTYLHRRGILHRDLKPENVLVTNGRVKLLDFGLATVIGRPTESAGTLLYMAPEVLTGSTNSSVASDLYAVGVIAFEVFAGKYPYYLDSITGVVDQILFEPPDVDSVSIDPPLKSVLKLLLAKDPEERYSNAQDVIEAFSAAINQTFPLETEATRESFLQAARFIGRDEEFALLIGTLENMFKGEGSAWLVGGESGVGKTRLLDELRTQALVRGALVLRGQAVSDGASTYDLWNDALRLLALLMDLSDLEASVLKAIVPDISDLVERDVRDAPTLSVRAAQTRLLSVVAGVVQRKTHALKTPTVLILEDLQWAGEESLALLNWLIRLTAAHSLLIIASYRDEEMPELPTRLPDMRLMHLERLSNESIADLSESMLGPSSGRNAAVLDLLQRETEGNVYFIVEVVRTLAEEAGQLDRVGRITLPTSVLAGGIQQLVQRRLDRIPALARGLLQFAAVAGRDLDLRVIGAAATAAGFDLEDWLTVCVNAAVLEIRQGDWRFAHDKLREQLLNNLSADERREYHRQVATIIESVYADVSSQASLLAYHWSRIGDTAREGYYALIAGDQAMARFANDEAERFLRRALVLTPAGMLPIVAKLGNLWIKTGKWPDAESILKQGISLPADDPDDARAQARCYDLLGTLDTARSNYDEALVWLEEARQRFAALEDSAGLVQVYCHIGSVYGNLGQTDDALATFERAFMQAIDTSDRDGQNAAMQLIADIYFRRGQTGLALPIYEEFLERAIELNDRGGIAHAYDSIATCLAQRGDHTAALSYLVQAVPVFAEIGDLHAGSHSTGRLASSFLEYGQYQNAQACCTRSLAISLDLADIAGIGVALIYYCEAYFRQGHFAEAERIGTYAVALARTMAAPLYLAGFLNTLSELYHEQHRYEEALKASVVALELAKRADYMDVVFAAGIMSLRLRFILGQLDTTTTVQYLELMLGEWDDPIKQAAVHYEIWRIDPVGQARHGIAAARLYREAYTTMPSLKIFNRYEELTRTQLPPLPEAPPLPDVVAQFSTDTDLLLARVEHIIAGRAVVPAVAAMS